MVSGKRRRKGLTVGTVLLVITMVATLGFALSSVSVQHLGLMNRQSNAEHALNLAESAVHLGIEKVLSSEDYQYGTEAGIEPIEIRLEGTLDGSVGVLSFDPDEADELGIPYSTNNINGEGSKSGSDDVIVPSEAVHFVAVGRSGGVERKVEVILHVPAFPYALASSGPISCVGGVTVASLEGDVLLSDSGVMLDPEHMFPAHILSNAAGASPGVSLGANTLVTGDVEAVGLLDIADGADVRGRLRQKVSPVDFPQFDITTYDPVDDGTQIEPNVGTNYVSTAGEEFRGQVRVNGGLEVQNGGITLDGAILYVDGPLTISSGGLKGRGILIVDGETRISGATRLEAENQVAVLSDGDLTLRGSGAESSFIRGLFYSRGVVRAEQLTVVGAMIAGDDSADSLTLVDARLFDMPGADVISIETTPPSSDPGSSASGEGTFTLYGDGHGGIPGRLGVGPNGIRPTPQFPIPTVRFDVSMADGQANVGVTFLASRDPVSQPVPVTHNIVIPEIYIHNPNGRPRDMRELAQVRQLASVFGVRLHQLGGRVETPFSALLQFGIHRAAQGTTPGGGDPTDPPPDPDPEPGSQIVTIDPSEFIDMVDRVQVVLWKVH